METTILIAFVGIIGGIIGSACTMFLQHYLTIKKDKQTELYERKREYATKFIEALAELASYPNITTHNIAGIIFMVEVYFDEGVTNALQLVKETPPRTVERDKALELLKLELKKELVN